MANIDIYLAQILAATYGEEVRGSIHDSISEINQEAIRAVDAAEGYKDSAKYYAELAATWSEHPPYIGDNGNWYVYDIPTKEFVDSGIDADRTLTIEDITMLGENESPTVTNTGTASDPIFHLFIPRGYTGNGITGIAKTSTDVLVDTYTITYKDGNTDTFTVNNGKGVVKIEKTGTTNLVDTYTITYNDGTSSTFNVANGKGISSFAKKSKDGLTTTYRFTYNDGTSDEFTVDDGNGITDISKTDVQGLKDIYTITYDNGSETEFSVNNGKGIISIAKTDTTANVDTYTITYNDGTTFDFQVTNGTDGDGSVDSINGIKPTGGDVKLEAKDVHAIPEQTGLAGNVLGFTSVNTVGPILVLDNVDDFANNTDEKALVNAETIAELLDETIVSTTLAATGWVNGIYTLETTYPSNKYALSVYLDTDTCTTDQEKAFNNARFRPFSRQNSIKCNKTVPEIDIPIILRIRRIG